MNNPDEILIGCNIVCKFRGSGKVMACILHEYYHNKPYILVEFSDWHLGGDGICEALKDYKAKNPHGCWYLTREQVAKLTRPVDEKSKKKFFIWRSIIC